MKSLRKGIVILLVLAAVSFALVLIMRPAELAVDSAPVTVRQLTVTVEEQGRTRARLPYTVTAPVSGLLQRPHLIEGDRVSAGQLMTQIALPPEDQRTEATLRANLSAAQARRTAAAASLSEAESALQRARREQERRAPLFDRGLIGEEERDLYQQTLLAAEARVLTARATLEAAQSEVESARSMLLGMDNDNGESVMRVFAPTDGTIYRVHERNERVVQAGTPLFHLSDGDALELVIDLLTQDAVRVTPGNRIVISGWGGAVILEGQVRYIEPEAFTKFSALGVEEQRVNVIGDLLSADTTLGAEYRIEAAIVVWEDDNVLTVPTSALFRRNGLWQVFVIEDQAAAMRAVELGQRSREFAQVLSGLQAGEEVILFPSDQIEEGVRVSPN